MMFRNSRRVLYGPQYVRGFANALAQARSDLDAFQCRHIAALDALHRELAATRDQLNELRATIAARRNAQDELAGLYREREIVRARTAEREPGHPLH